MEKHWTYYAAKLFSKILCLLPYRAVLWLGRQGGCLYYHIAAKLRRRAETQMMRGLSITQQEAAPILRSMFCKVLLNGLEFFYMPRLAKETINEIVEIHGLEYMDEALNKGRGVVLLTAHFGNWEIFGVTMAMLGYPMVGLGKQQPKEGITTLLTEYRTRFGGEIYYKGTAVRHVMRALKDNKVMFMVSDQDGGKDGIFIEFLNKPASTPPGPAAFARKTGAAVLPGFIRREGSKHIITIEPPMSLQETEDADADIRGNLITMTKRVEAQIRKYPDEWLWFQKRWNTPMEVTCKDE